MESSLLYHMAMVTKMSAESQIILEELMIDTPLVEEQALMFYRDFVSDAKELLKDVIEINDKITSNVKNITLDIEKKILIFNKLSGKISKVEEMIDELNQIIDTHLLEENENGDS